MMHKIEWERRARSFFRLAPTVLGMIFAVVGLIFPHLFDMAEHHAVIYITLLVLGGIQIFLLIVADKQSQHSEPSPLKEGEFVKLYSEALTDVVTSIPLLHALENGQPAFTEADRKGIISAILKNLCTIAAAYKDDSQKGHLEINAGWYRPVSESTATASQKAAAQVFMDPNRSSYQTFLVLTDWAYHGERMKTSLWFSKTQPKACVQEGFVLPVDEDEQYVMFGAPRAFVTGDVQYVNDIHGLLADDKALSNLSGMHNENVRKGMTAHFSPRTSYESFIDVPLLWGNHILGVVVIQSKKEFFFDQKNKDDLMMLNAMQPFLSLLGLFVS